MNGSEATRVPVIFRVHRFTPRPQRAARRRASSPFGASSSPFGAHSATHAVNQPRGKHWIQEYRVEANPTDTILDCLLTIKRTLDPTLAFRYSCGHGMCGSDAASVNGTPTLLCTATVGEWARPAAARFRATTPVQPGSTPQDVPADDSLQDAQTVVPTALNNEMDRAPATIELEALPGFAPLRDLIADTDAMFEQMKRLEPYLQAAGTARAQPQSSASDGEYLQSPDQLKRFELLSDCIACGVCEGSCPVYAGGEAFIGPAALILASRFINDSRDTATTARLEAIDTQDGINACQSVRACGRHCPRGIDVGEEMWQLTTKVSELNG